MTLRAATRVVLWALSAKLVLAIVQEFVAFPEPSWRTLSFVHTLFFYVPFILFFAVLSHKQT